MTATEAPAPDAHPAGAAGEGAADTLYSVSGHIATITLNRPEKFNTLGGSMLRLLSEYVRQAERDPDVRAIIITANGRHFCAGLDLAEAAAGRGPGNEIGAGAVTIDATLAPPTVIYNCEKPVICAMNGAAAGYGMDLALACDIRVLARSAKFVAAPVKRGLLPESGGTWILPRLVGWEKAAEIFFAARTLDAEESLGLGLCLHVADDDQLLTAATQLANEIAANAPLAVQSAKRLMRMGLSQQFNDHCHHVYVTLMQLMRTADTREGIGAFIERRTPRFEGR